MEQITRKAILWLVFLLIITGSLLSLGSISAKSVVQSNSNDLIAAVNSLRIKNGLPPYNPHPTLMQIAQAHADYMAAIGSVTHYGPNGERPFQRALNAGYPVAGDLSLGGFFSENILAGQFTAERAVEIWQGDAPHLNTMLSPNLQDIGAGVTKVGDFIYYVIDAGLASNAPVNYTPESPVGSSDTPNASQFIVPVVKSTPDESGMVYHEVQSGQSLWTIAIAYGTKIDEIRRLNNLQTGAPIYPGDKLLVLRDAMPTPVEVVNTSTPTINLMVSNTPKQPTQTVATDILTSTPDLGIPESSSESSAGVVVAIVLVVVLFSGLLTWVSARRGV